MARDDSLRETLAEIASQSRGKLTFEVASLSGVGKEQDWPLGRSPNPIYRFSFTNAQQERVESIAFTLSLDAAKRPATRAEALAASIAATDGAIFKLNPFLLVYDYVGHRLLAVSAAALFGAYADFAANTSQTSSATSNFSLTPNFERSSIYMYAEVRPPDVWAIDTGDGGLTLTKMLNHLTEVVERTASFSSERTDSVVQAITRRLRSPTAGEAATNTRVTPGRQGVDGNGIADERLEVDDRTWRMLMTAIEASPALLLVGPPGTGKSALLRKAIRATNELRFSQGLGALPPPLWATPDESWTARDLIGGETISEGNIVFRPGWVLRAIADDRWLVLDEANRGDLDKIFGALLTWLAGGTVSVGVESSLDTAKIVELGWTNGTSRVEETGPSEGPAGESVVRYLAGHRWRLLGTYNALDAQRVFRFGAALGRRFLRVPILPLPPSMFRSVLLTSAQTLGTDASERIALVYEAHYEDELTRLGPAQFLAMREYLGAASARTAGGSEGSDAELGADGLLDFADPLSTDISLASTQGVVGPSLDALVGEAYVLGFGTFLAQLDERDLENLLRRIADLGAISPEEVQWVRETIPALG